MSESAQNVFFVFPGQGSQYAGMGSDVCNEFEVAREIYAQANDVLGYDIAELSFNDPDEQLNLTRFTQPALLTHSIACLEVFRELTDDRLKPAIAAGHSLGEYSALVAAKVLSFESALKLVQKRGELMGTHGEGEMSAFPLDPDTIRPIAERHRCAIAGLNLPEQTVIGGRSEDLESVERDVKEQYPRKRAFRLKTEGAFHTYYMVKAAQHFQADLDAMSFEPSDIRVLSNFSGGYHEPDPVDIRARLFFQLFNPVLWHSNLVTAFGDGVETIIEFGGGIGKATEPEGKRPNLEGMIKKAMHAASHEALYMAAINLDSLKKTADFVNNPG
jgi:[acyl-carrier-protein] S-malonyltransferase